MSGLWRIRVYDVRVNVTFGFKSQSALCRIRFNVVPLNVVWLNVVRLNVVRVNVIRHIVGVT